MIDILIIDIWLSKIKNYGWKIEDASNKEIKEELRRILNEKIS